MVPIYKVNLGKLEKKYVNQCLDTNWISSSGKFVEKFETVFAKYLKVKYALSTPNGTSALHLLLATSEIGPDDEVIIPDFTFISTALAVSYTGAKIVPVDIEKDTWNINPKLIEKAITKKTKAILPVDIYGLPANIPEIKKIARKHNLLILQDSAESLGSEINNQKTGTNVDGAIFSFYGNKTITTGEGGMLVTNNKKIYEKARMLKEYGRGKKERYKHFFLGFNYRMTNIQAAIGLAQLSRIEKVIKRKVQIRSFYQKLLKDTPGISFQTNPPGFFNSSWLISIVIDEKKYGLSKNKLAKILNSKGFETRDFFLPIHSQPVYIINPGLVEGYPIHLQPVNQKSLLFSNRNTKYNLFPISNSVSENGLSLPSFPSLTYGDIKTLCKHIKQNHR